MRVLPQGGVTKDMIFQLAIYLSVFARIDSGFFKPVENLILYKNLEDFFRKSCGKPEESSKKVHPSPRLSPKIKTTLIARQYIHKYSAVESCKWISMVVMIISSNLQHIYATLERFEEYLKKI